MEGCIRPHFLTCFFNQELWEWLVVGHVASRAGLSVKYADGDANKGPNILGPTSAPQLGFKPAACSIHF